MRRYWSLWRELFTLSWRRQRRHTAATLTAIALSTLAVPVCAVALRRAVDAIDGGHTSTAVMAAAVAALAYAVSLVLQDTAGLLRATTNDRLGRLELHPRIHRDISRVHGLEHLERTDFLDRMTIVRLGTGHVTMSLWNMVLAVSNVLKLVLAVLLLGTVTPWLGLLLVFAALPVWLDHVGQRRVRRVEVETSEDHRLHRRLAELAVSASAGKELRVSGTAEDVIRRQTTAWYAAMGPRARAQFVAGALKLVGWLVFIAAFVGALALITHRTVHGHGTVGDVVLAVTVAMSLRQTVASTVMSTTSTASARRVLDPYLWMREYTEREATRDQGEQTPPAALTDGISVENVSYAYPGTDRLALDGVSVTLPAGAVVAVVGEYGSGKTTLVKLLQKFYQTDSGRITVDGIDLSRLDTERWRDRSSAVFQDFGRFRTTFAETVGLGDLRHVNDRERIQRALGEVEADDLVRRLPNGLDTQLGRELGGLDLSEGQWQRTALARAAMRTDPLLFVLDEPTASLDAPSEQNIFEQHMARARHLGQRTGAITLIVSHRFSTVAGADHILVLDKGRLVESGTHEDLLALRGQYADLYRLQADAYAESAPATTEEEDA
ncbi:ABC transporter ATP-binding protein [Streptomyces sedi]|uniref:ABC transporter ATP-binding protein n=1 Tax=Streptomyces sedi TaxID=555059 RepID=A0A5C4URE0_9ACTN|nr:ABC transporter ATP-binding protein [Streptomyces sedi]TNM25853.1 ABC transporter ATP-binding protein [Streptomyces sedi]